MAATMGKRFPPTKGALVATCVCLVLAAGARDHPTGFKVIAFFPDNTEEAHLSFVREANQWFSNAAAENGFSYEATADWSNLNREFVSRYQVVLFLNARPESAEQRSAFQEYMEKGGAWMGFHYAGFALTPSDVPQSWDWYHRQFLGAGEYKGNTWRPTSAVLRVEDSIHAATRRLPATFRSAPNEWYSWKNDLRANADIRILLSIDPQSFPLGTGPKPHEIWHSGDYPVVWVNQHYRMMYLNMGHNDLEFKSGTNRQLSFTFANEIQNRLILDGLLWLGSGNAIASRPEK